MMRAMRTTRPAPTTSRALLGPPTARAVLLRFFLGSAVAVAVALVGGYIALRAVAIEEAKRDTRTKVQEAGQLVESAMADGLLTGQPAAMEAVDDVVLARVLSSSVVRVRIWAADGSVLYSDDPRQIGGRYALDADQRRLLREGGAEVEVSDLSRPENELDQGQGDLIEAYTRIRTPSGTPVLFEIYERFDSVTASARRLLRALAPPILGAIALIVLVQIPLVWSLTRRLQRSHEEREALLANAIAASNRERRRIASYLHDGPVQDIAGVAFALAPLADTAAARGDPATATTLRAVIEQLRHNVRDLRTLLVDLYPPNLAAAGLAAAIADLVSPLEARGVEVSVLIDDADPLDAGQETLVYRVAQEALRNVVAYADARTVRVELTRTDGTARLVVRDDGRGFTPEARERRKAEGHLGLSLLEELVRQAGGRLDVRSAEGQGTSVELEVPGL
jgi:two-component system NarL family sensor kinase